MNSNNNNRLLAIDLGYSNVKVAYYDNQGVLQFDKYISATAKLNNPMDPDDDTIFQLGVDYFILGTPALKVSNEFQLKLETFEDMKIAYPVWISYLLKKYNKENFDHIIIGLSMAFQDRADELLTYLYESLLIDPSTNYFLCLPQGLSCKLTYAECGLDIKEISKHNDARMRNYIILDGGFLTCDICSVVNGTAAAGNAIGVPNTGVICVAQQVVDYLFKHFEFTYSIKKAQVIVDNNGVFLHRGREYNIKSELDGIIKKYLGDVLDLLDKSFASDLDACEGVIVLGGLSYFFKKYINDPDVVAMIERHFPVGFLHFPTTDSEFFNAYSYLRIGQMKLTN